MGEKRDTDQIIGLLLNIGRDGAAPHAQEIVGVLGDLAEERDTLRAHAEAMADKAISVLDHAAGGGRHIDGVRALDELREVWSTFRTDFPKEGGGA